MGNRNIDRSCCTYGPIIDRLMGIIEPFSFAVAGMKKENKKGK